MVTFGRRAGYHLAEQAGKEKHHAEYNCKQGEIEQRLVGDRPELEPLGLMNKLGGNDPHGHHKAHQEHQQAAVAEEVHGFFPECAQEPKALQVQEAVDETLQTEFALAVFAFLVVYGLLADSLERYTIPAYASETGDSTYRVIEGITDKYYDVKNLNNEGTYVYKVKAIYTDGTESKWSNAETVTLQAGGQTYAQGDVNMDGSVNISDVTDLIDMLLSDNTKPSGDVNGDGSINITDVTDLIDLLLKN